MAVNADQMPGTGGPLVSVITIFLDPGPFLEEAIASVEGQTHGEWELLLVDDGSRDGSSHVARRAAARRPDRIRHLTHPGGGNRGMSASRNLGIAHARGDLIAFLDADDVYLPEKLGHQIEILRREPRASFTFGPTLYWFSWTGDPADTALDRLRRMPPSPDRLYEPPELVELFLTDVAATPATCSVLIRREAVERAGGFEEAFTGMHEDQVFFYKLCAQETGVAHARNLDRYRQHPASECNQALATGRWTRTGPNPSRRAFLEWLAPYLDQRGLLAPGTARTIRAELRMHRHPRLARAVGIGGRVGDAARRRGRQAARLLRRDDRES